MVAPVELIVIAAEWVPAGSPFGRTLTAIVPAFVPVVEAAPFTFSQVILDMADHVNVPAPTLLMVIDWAVGVVPFCTAANESTVGARLIVGVGEGGGGGVMVGEEGGAINWANPGISMASRRMDRLPPDPPLPEEDVLPPAAANGRIFDWGEDDDARPLVGTVVIAGAGTPTIPVPVASEDLAPEVIVPDEDSDEVCCEDVPFIGADVVLGWESLRGITDAVGGTA